MRNKSVTINNINCMLTLYEKNPYLDEILDEINRLLFVYGLIFIF